MTGITARNQATASFRKPRQGPGLTLLGLVSRALGLGCRV